MRRLQLIFISLFVVLVFLLQKSYTSVVSAVQAATEESVVLQKDTIINEMSLKVDSTLQEQNTTDADSRKKKKSKSLTKNDSKTEPGKVAQKIRRWESDVRN